MLVSPRAFEGGRRTRSSVQLIILLLLRCTCDIFIAPPRALKVLLELKTDLEHDPPAAPTAAAPEAAP